MAEIPERIDWAELVPQKWNDPGLLLTVRYHLSMTGAHRLGVRVERERTNDAGRKLKPEHIITIVGEPGEGLDVLLQSIAGGITQGVVEVNQ